MPVGLGVPVITAVRAAFDPTEIGLLRGGEREGGRQSDRQHVHREGTRRRLAVRVVARVRRGDRHVATGPGSERGRERA